MCLKIWDLCDQFVVNLLSKTEYALDIAFEIFKIDREFAKRAGIITIVKLLERERIIWNEEIEKIMKKGLADKRKYVRKAAEWLKRIKK